MPGLITKDLIDVSTADTATGWSGASGGLDDEVYKQDGTGTGGAYTWQTGKNTVATCTFTPAANINMTANYTTPHLYWTMRCDVMTFCEALNTGATNSGFMLRVTDGSGNYVQWHMQGRDTWDGGWKNFVLDLTRTSDIHSSSGTLDLSDVDVISFITDNSNSGTIRIIDNTWCDVLRYGDGLQANSITTEAFGFTDIALDDVLIANYYGVLQDVDGVLFAQGLITLGDLTDTNDTNFGSIAETVYFKDQPVGASHYGIKGVEATNANNPTDISITALVCKTVGDTGAEFDFSDADLNSFELIGSTLINMGLISFGSGSVDTSKFSGGGASTVLNCTVTDCTWVLSGLISLTGTTTVIGCVIEDGTASASMLTASLETITNCSFASDGSNHAVELSSLGDGSMDWDNQLSGYAASDGSTGNEAIYVNVGSGSLTINVASGASTPSIRTAGATVTVVAGAVTVSVTVKNSAGEDIENANVFLRASDATGPFPYKESVTITNSGTTATVSHPGHGLSTNDKVDIKGANENEYNGVKQITVTGVDAYTYITEGSPATPATGTISSTFVALEGLSSALGIVSTSRTYSTDQPIKGWVRKSTISPYYKQSTINDEVTSASGFTTTIGLILDE